MTDYKNNVPCQGCKAEVTTRLRHDRGQYLCVKCWPTTDEQQLTNDEFVQQEIQVYKNSHPNEFPTIKGQRPMTTEQPTLLFDLPVQCDHCKTLFPTRLLSSTKEHLCSMCWPEESKEQRPMTNETKEILDELRKLQATILQAYLRSPNDTAYRILLKDLKADLANDIGALADDYERQISDLTS